MEPTEIATRRLVLRPFRLGDESDVLEYGSDAEFAYFANNAAPMTVKDAERIVQRAIATTWDVRLRWAITLSAKVIGAIELEPSWPDLVANLGYEVARSHWGEGIATESASAVVAFAFEKLDLEKVYARADPRNTPSVRVLEKLGMRQEGLLRSQLVRRGERVDRVYYGILRNEWRLPE
jgi:ribosomal-protein-alanine N-acetyltransferase